MFALRAFPANLAGSAGPVARHSINNKAVPNLVNVADDEKLTQIDITTAARWAAARYWGSFVHLATFRYQLADLVAG